MGILKVLIALIIVYVLNRLREFVYEKITGLSTTSESDRWFKITVAILMAAWIVRDGLL